MFSRVNAYCFFSCPFIDFPICSLPQLLGNNGGNPVFVDILVLIWIFHHLFGVEIKVPAVHHHCPFIDGIADHPADVGVGKTGSVSFSNSFFPEEPGDGPAAVARGTQLIHLAFHLRFLFDDFETFIWQFPVAVSVGSEHQGIPRLLAVLMGIVYFAA